MSYPKAPADFRLMRFLVSSVAGARAFATGIALLLVGITSAHAAALSIRDVSAPDINCKFDPTCKIVVADTATHFTLPGTTGDAFLQSRTWPAGKPGTAGAGLVAYLYRLDLRQLAGVTALPCVNRLTLDFGPVAPLDYDGNGTTEQVFVITKGGLGTVKPSSASQSGSTVTFNFSSPVCAGASVGSGDSSYFFGLASTHPPHGISAQIRDTLGGTQTLAARAPQTASAAAIFDPAHLHDVIRRHWQQFNAEYGGRWHVEWSSVTGTPSLIDGYAAPLATPVTRDTIEARARSFLEKLAPVLAIDVRDLKLGRAELQAPANAGTGDGTWYLAFHQAYRGVPVLGGSVRLVVSNNKVVSTRAQTYPGIERPVDPGIPLQQAVAAIGPPRAEPERHRLVIVPRPLHGRIQYHLAWEVVMPVEKAPYGSAVPAPKGTTKDDLLKQMVPVQWRYLVDADTGEVLQRRNIIDYDEVHGTVTGSVHPAIPADTPVTEPIAHMTTEVQQGAITHSADTDAAGTYHVTGLATGTGSLTAHLTGPHVQVFNDETPDPDATHTASVSAPGTHDWDWSGDDPSPGDVETNAFYHVNKVRDWFLRGTPFDVAAIPDPLPVHVRNGPYCNAGAGGAGLSFGNGTSSCEDFALCSDIVYHEYTHRIVHAVYDGSGVDLYATEERGAMNEAWADFFAVSLTNDPAHGEGCYTGRNVDTPDHRYPDDWVGEPHYDGLIFSGALWDLRAALDPNYVDSLAIRAMKRTPTGYVDYLAAVLEEDDDPAYSTEPSTANNNPADGTPNIDAICHSYFDIHGIFHPYCSGHTQTPVAVITQPDPQTFNLYTSGASTVTIEGSALGAAGSPFDHYVLEYAHESAPATWMTAGMTLTGGGASPVSGGTLGILSLAGLAEGVYVVRLTVFDSSSSASAKTSFDLDLSLKTGWPQAGDSHFYGTPAAADLDPATPGLEIVAGGTDGFLYAWHSDGTTVAGWPKSIGYTTASPAVADLDGDGVLEVVSAAYYTVYAFHQDGSAVTGWPQSAGDRIYGTTALADLDGDGKLEVIAASATQVLAWHDDGTPVAGWPVSPGVDMHGSPAVGDLDGDGLPEIVLGTQDGRVFAWHHDGTPVTGWPQTIAGATEASTAVALGDLDGDGLLEVAAATSDFTTYTNNEVMVWHGDGSAVAGWPQDLGEYSFEPASVAMADVDSDGQLDVVIMSNDDNIHVFHANGTALAGWPPAGMGISGYEFTVSSPSIADLDGDGNKEIVAEGFGNDVDSFDSFKVYAFHHDGSAVSGWPKAVSRYSNSSPTIADVDGDGNTEIVVGSDGVFVWDLPGTYDGNGAEWPTYRHDNRRTGTYLPKAGVVLLFDTSGSMSWRPDDTTPAPPPEQRIAFAKEAAYPFLEELNDFNSGNASFGIATFPSHPSGSFPFSCGAQAVTPMTLITDASKNTAVTTTIPGLVTEDNTPLLAGMSQAAAMLDVQRNAAVVLLSDGYHNCPTAASIGDPDVMSLIDSLNQRSIRVFSIGFGRPTDPDHPLLEGLANQTTPPGYAGSQFYDVTTPSFDPLSWTPATALQGTYKSILVDALGLQAATDPLAVVTGGSSASHPVHLNEHDRRVSFYLSWKTPQRKRLSLRVRASDGSVVSAGPGVRMHSGSTYAIVTVDKSYLSATGKVGPTPWTMDVTASGVPSGQQEPYQYSVILDSALRFEPRLGKSVYYAGDKLLLTARLTEAGAPLATGADVRVQVTRPREGLGTWLSRHRVTAAELEQVPERRGSEILQPFQRKAIYLQEVRKVKLPRMVYDDSMPMYDDGTHGDATAGDGTYSIQIATTKPGVYSFHLHAAGKTGAGLGFDRDRVLQKYIDVKPLPEFTRVVVRRLGASRVEVLIKPQDRLGNLAGPGQAARLRVRTAVGKLSGPLTDALDGTYRQAVELPRVAPTKRLRVAVSVDARAAIVTKPVLAPLK